MATRILEYGGADRNDGLPVIPALLTAQTTLTATGTSAQSAAFGSGTNMVCIQSDEAVYVAFGSNPTATTSNHRLSAGGEAYFSVTPGHKVAVRT